MDPILKQRLVGAAVLSALAVIFIPMLFDESGSSPDARDFEIPEIPAYLRQAPPESPGKVEPVNPQAAESVPDTAIQEIPGDGQTKPPLRSWVIQLGSFSKPDAAQRLRDQLRTAGFPAHVETGRVNGELLFRVRVGPELDLERARGQRDTIAQKFDLKGIVIPVP